MHTLKSSFFYLNSKKFVTNYKKSIKPQILPEGKTYLFKINALGHRMELYHASLYCNDLHILVNFDYVNDIEDRFKRTREKWVNAPYADEVGQSDDPDHYVC